jgi:Ca-activated chloride channel family protein
MRAICCLLLVAWGPATVFADTPRALAQQGNEHYEAGRYAEALAAYEQIGEEADQTFTTELLHNRAATHFKLGDFDEARELWVRAAGLKDEPFEAAARYNLGNCDYLEALQAVQEQNASRAVELLDRATAQYRDALRLDSTLADARANLELAAQLRKQIEEAAQQQPQSQPSPKQEQQGEQQQSTSQPSSQPTSQPGESEPQPSESEQQEQAQPESQPAPQPESQPAPETQPAQLPESQPSGGEEGIEEEQQRLVPIEMTPEEAERLLQMIRDAERQRRAILRAREAAGHKEVDKDW